MMMMIMMIKLTIINIEVWTGSHGDFGPRLLGSSAGLPVSHRCGAPSDRLGEKMGMVRGLGH